MTENFDISENGIPADVSATDGRSTSVSSDVYVVNPEATTPEAQLMSLEDVLKQYGEENVYISKFSNEEYESFAGKASAAKLAYDDAVTRQSGLQMARDRLKNILFSNTELILDVYQQYNFLRRMVIDISEELDSVRSAMAQSDKEFSDLNRKYRELLSEKENTESPKKSKRG